MFRTDVKLEDQSSTTSSCTSKISGQSQSNFKSSSLTTSTEHHKSILDNVFNTFQPGLKAHRGFIIENKNGSVFCTICDIDINNFSKISEHLKTKAHEDKTISLIKDKLPNDLEGSMEFVSFYGSNLCCNLCRCKIELCSNNPHETIVNILAHNTRKTHSEKKSNEEMPKNGDACKVLKFLSDISQLVKDNKDFIICAMQPQFKCKLCEKQIMYNEDENTMLQNFKAHLESEGHKRLCDLYYLLTTFENSFSSSGKNHSFSVSKGSIICTICKCSIEANIENLMEHAKKPLNHENHVLSSPSSQYIKKSQIMSLKDILKSLPSFAPEIYQINYCLVEVEKGTVACTICSFCLLESSVDAVLNHINGNSHTERFKGLKAGPKTHVAKDEAFKSLLDTLHVPNRLRKNLCLNDRGEVKCLVCNSTLSATSYDLQTHLQRCFLKYEEELSKNTAECEVFSGNKNIGINTLLKTLPPPFKNISYIVESGQGQVTCLICNCIIPATTYNLTTHLDGTNHTKNIQEISKPVDKNDQPTQIESDYGLLSTSNSLAKTTYLLADKNSSHTTYQGQQKSKYDPSKQEKTTENIKSLLKHLVLKNDGKYFCNVCDCEAMIVRYDDSQMFHDSVMSHFSSVAHVKAFTEKEDLVVKDLFLSTDSVIKTNKPFFKWQGGNLMCTLCVDSKPFSVSLDLLATQDNVISHCNGKQHVKNLENLGEASSSFPGPSGFYCITPSKDLPATFQKDGIFKEGSTISSGVCLKSLLESLPQPFRNISYIIESSPHQVTCLICKCIIPATTYNLSTHLTGNSHFTKEQELAKPFVQTDAWQSNNEDSNKDLANRQEKVVKKLLLLPDIVLDANRFYLEKRGNILICTLCNQSMSISLEFKGLYTNVVSHLRGKSHVSKVSASSVQTGSKQTMNENDKKGFLKSKEEVVKELLLSTDTVLQTNRLYLKKQGENLICTLCNQSMSISLELKGFYTNVVSHLRGKSHVSNKVSASSVQTDSKQTMNENDKKGFLKSKAEVVKQLLLSTDTVLQTNRLYLEKQGKNLICTLCNQSMSISLEFTSFYRNVYSHLRGKSHVSKVGASSVQTDSKQTVNESDKKGFFKSKEVVKQLPLSTEIVLQSISNSIQQSIVLTDEILKNMEKP